MTCGANLSDIECFVGGAGSGWLGLKFNAPRLDHVWPLWCVQYQVGAARCRKAPQQITLNAEQICHAHIHQLFSFCPRIGRNGDLGMGDAIERADE